MGLLRRINLKVFLLAFAFGLLACYMMAPAPEVVVKFPSPYNAGQVVYKDKAGTCFKYKADKSSCPRDQSSVKQQPIMEDFRRS
jgi:hypothetical protein